MVGGDVPSGALLAGAAGAAHPSAWEADEKTGVFNTTEGVLNTTHGGDRYQPWWVRRYGGGNSFSAERILILTTYLA